MIFLTAMILGMTTLMLRSALCTVVVCLLLSGAFGLAMILSAGPVSIFPLLIALGGYNFGLMNVILGLVAFEKLRTA